MGLGIALVMGILTTAWAGEGKPANPDAVLRGDAECTICHEEEDSVALLAIGKSKHGTLADSRTPTCTSCHGSSRDHLVKPPGQDKRTPPDITFGRRFPNQRPDEVIDQNFGNFNTAITPVATRNEACLNCHREEKLTFWNTSAHSSQEVACTNCHEIHTGHDRALDPKSQPNVCYSCHKQQRMMFNRPSHHPVPEGKMACADCHNPHGSTGPKALKKDSVNDTCYQCHMEKRGPFLHAHPPVAEDCLICHNPHGTTIAGLLNYRPPYLCQDCHSDSGHRGMPGGLPTSRASITGANMTNMMGSVGRGCLNCHTNIHGGNSSQNSATAGRFRR
ncbi:MAG: DmsE family decaheme c-type cytochrome [Magnetococcales bacterium]|nr:DmsE family decaheme c-type cytochrome [Magnetococcales bacterium]